jgi:hypothetical protein
VQKSEIYIWMLLCRAEHGSKEWNAWGLNQKLVPLVKCRRKSIRRFLADSLSGFTNVTYAQRMPGSWNAQVSGIFQSLISEFLLIRRCNLCGHTGRPERASSTSLASKEYYFFPEHFARPVYPSRSARRRSDTTLAANLHSLDFSAAEL